MFSIPNILLYPHKPESTVSLDSQSSVSAFPDCYRPLPSIECLGGDTNSLSSFLSLIDTPNDFLNVESAIREKAEKNIPLQTRSFFA